MREDEQKKCERDPEPADLDEVDVEDVAFLCEIARRLVRRIGLGVGVVHGVADCWMKKAEDRAKNQCPRVDGEKYSLKSSRKERRTCDGRSIDRRSSLF